MEVGNRMGELLLNRGQKKAIETIDSNLVVNAGAGTGKTTVLVERYLEILDRGQLEEGREVESIVAITFTKKAAQEMIERVRTRLREKMEESGQEKWKIFYRDIEKANISTIHSFCGNILRENTIELGLDPRFKILEDNSSKNLLREAIEEVLDQRIETRPGLYKLLRDLGLIYKSKIVENFTGIYNKMRSDGLSLDSLRELVVRRAEEARVREEDLVEIEELFAFLFENVAGNGRIHRLREDERFLSLINRSFSSEAELVDILSYCEDFLGNPRKVKEEIDQLRARINQVKKVLEVENLDYYMEILEFIRELDRVYSRKKKEVSGLDYEDLQLKLRDLLEDPLHRSYYQDKYQYIMIDEFQDTNGLQKEIFYKLASRKEKLDRENLFVVGDPKQSIYGFRGGDLEVFYEVIGDITSRDQASHISLDVNYRTVGNIIEFVNYLFSQLMETGYEGLEAHKQALENTYIEVLEREELEVPESESKSDYNRGYEAELIAKRIKSLVDGGFRLEGDRPCQYGDIALLFRAGTRTSIYEAALRKYGIPCYNMAGSGLLEKDEIEDLINAFKAFYNPNDLISNIGFLRSPLIGFSDEDIFYLMEEEGSIGERLRALEPGKIEEELLDRARSIYRDLADSQGRLNNYEFLSYLVERTGFNESLLLVHNGRQAHANLEKFLELFHDYEREGLEETYDILSYLDELRTRDIAEAKIISEKSNTVRFLTIHKSKGLEFPVVILPEMSIQIPNTAASILYSKDLGLGLNIEGRDSNHKEISEAYKEGERQESIRLLYVAMTRAENLLILGNQGSKKGFKAMIQDHLVEEHCRLIEDIDLGREPGNETSYLKLDGLELKGELYPRNLLEYEDHARKTIDSLSISQYMKFKACRREYYLDNFLGLGDSLDLIGARPGNDLAQEGLSPLDKGNIVHKFCQLYRADSSRDRLLAQLAEELNYGYGEVQEAVGTYIDNFISSYREDYDQVYREKAFSVKIKSARFTGVIDRINIEGDRIEIIDYKTNRVFNRQALYRQYADQIRFYAFILGQIFKRPVSSGRLHLLETGEYLDIDLSQDKIGDSLRRLEEFVDFVREKDHIDDYQKSESCREFCSYYRLCN